MAPITANPLVSNGRIVLNDFERRFLDHIREYAKHGQWGDDFGMATIDWREKEYGGRNRGTSRAQVDTYNAMVYLLRRAGYLILHDEDGNAEEIDWFTGRSSYNYTVAERSGEDGPESA